MDIEGRNPCPYDGVIFLSNWECESSYTRPADHLGMCGNQTGTGTGTCDYYSLANKVDVLFRSDGSVTMGGFKLKLTAVDLQTGGWTTCHGVRFPEWPSSTESPSYTTLPPPSYTTIPPRPWTTQDPQGEGECSM